MTPDQLKTEIEKLLAENGYELQVVIIDAGGLDITEALAKQRGYAPVVQVVKKSEPERGRTPPP